MHKFTRPSIEMIQHFSPYPLIFVHDKSNEVICEQCAKNLTLIFNLDNNLFTDYVYDVHYEGASITCESCNKEIDSAYGAPDTEE